MNKKEFDAIGKHLKEIENPDIAAMYAMATKAALLNIDEKQKLETIREDYRYIYTPVSKKGESKYLSTELYPNKKGNIFNIMGRMEVINRKTDQSNIVYACIEFLYNTAIIFWVNETRRMISNEITDQYTQILYELCPELTIIAPDNKVKTNKPKSKAESQFDQMIDLANKLPTLKKDDPGLTETYEKINDLGHHILTTYHDFPYRSGVYTTLAYAAFLMFLIDGSPSPAHKELLLAKEHAIKAMSEDGRNQKAKAIGIITNLFTLNIPEATALLSQMSDNGLAEACASTQNLSIYQFTFYLPAQDDIEKHRKAVYDFLTTLCEKTAFDKDLQSSCTASYVQLIFTDYGDVQTAYSLLNKQIKDQADSPKHFTIYSLLCMVCQDPRIKKNDEAIHYGKLGMKYVKGHNEQEQANINSFYGMALALTGDRNCVYYCKKAVQVYPSDTTYFNYGRCLLLSGKAKQGIPWALKALYLHEDEQNYILLADIYQATEQDDLAAEYYLKAFQNIQKQNLLHQFTDENGMKTLSATSNVSLEYSLHHIFLNTISIYMKHQDYKNAIIHLQLADELVPDYPEWEIYKKTLPVIEYSKKELQEARDELLLAKEEVQKQTRISQELAEKLIRIQDQFGHSNMDNYKNWNQFTKEIDAIIAQLEKEANKDEKRMESVREKFSALFSNFSPEAIHFLTTAEVLYEMHKNNEIDFACIIIEYCKVLENQLRKVLGDQIPEDMKMLGKIIGLIRDTKESPYKKCLGLLNEVNELRKQSAHTGSLKKKEAQRIRSIYFEEGLLDLLN